MGTCQFIYVADKNGLKPTASRNLARSRAVTQSRKVLSSKERQNESEDMTAQQCGDFCND